MKKNIRYNPALSVAENAFKNGVSEDAVRYYIKSHHIDRRKEAAVRIINACRKVLAEQPDLTPYKVAHEIGASVNTVKKILGVDSRRKRNRTVKYWRKETPNFDTTPET